MSQLNAAYETKYKPHYHVTLTNDQELLAEPVVKLTTQQVVDYLGASPRNAVVIHKYEDEYHGTLLLDQPAYVLRGASDGEDNFYWGAWPAEDPGDANGGDLTALEAISAPFADNFQ